MTIFKYKYIYLNKCINYYFYKNDTNFTKIYNSRLNSIIVENSALEKWKWKRKEKRKKREEVLLKPLFHIVFFLYYYYFNIILNIYSKLSEEKFIFIDELFKEQNRNVKNVAKKLKY